MSFEAAEEKAICGRFGAPHKEEAWFWAKTN
jgi:hypothetical protein